MLLSSVAKLQPWQSRWEPLLEEADAEVELLLCGFQSWDEENLPPAPGLCIKVSSKLIVATCGCVLTHSDASCLG